MLLTMKKIKSFADLKEEKDIAFLLSEILLMKHYKNKYIFPLNYENKRIFFIFMSEDDSVFNFLLR